MTFEVGRWSFYDELIDTVPEAARIRNFVLGRHWVMIESDLGGVGLAQHFLRGEGAAPTPEMVGRPLKEVAAWLKSWDFHLASLGMAALNAASNTLMLVPDSPLSSAAAKARGCAFEFFQSKIEGRKVAVIGHFPHLETKLAGHCQLSIFERRPLPGDLPDPAAEYLLPEQDVVYMTGTTFINKTITRLLELAQNAEVCVVGPSTPMIPLLFKYGIHSLSGLVVTDYPDLARAITEDLCDEIFERGGVKVNLIRDGGD